MRKRIKNMEYQKLIQIINQNTISANEVSEAISILISLDTAQFREEDFQRIEEFIVDINAILKTENEDDLLKQIIYFIRDRKV
jgi:hypothetical protein